MRVTIPFAEGARRAGPMKKIVATGHAVRAFDAGPGLV